MKCGVLGQSRRRSAVAPLNTRRCSYSSIPSAQEQCRRFYWFFLFSATLLDWPRRPPTVKHRTRSSPGPFFVLSSGKRDKFTFTKAQIQHQKESLAAHNSYRARHCVPALKLNDEISASAQKYAEHLAAHEKFEHSEGSDDYGENLYTAISLQPLKYITGRRDTILECRETTRPIFRVKLDNGLVQ
jgi:hypothetical protein